MTIPIVDSPSESFERKKMLMLLVSSFSPQDPLKVTCIHLLTCLFFFFYIFLFVQWSVKIIYGYLEDLDQGRETKSELLGWTDR